MQSTHEHTPNEHTSWLERPFRSIVDVNWETVLYTIIIVLAIISRFYAVGERAMSHDEVSHVYFSWRLYEGDGYQHDPVTHGPLQFHLIALSYFLFDDSDFSARIPAALFSVATIAFMWFYRRYLGRAGALIAAFLLLISPIILFYGRYARNEAFVALFGVITLWSILRYLETGASKYIFVLTAVTALHFTTKETSFIYTAQALIFLALYFLLRVFQKRWPKPVFRNRFLGTLIIGVFLLAAAAGFMILGQDQPAISGAETAQPAVPGEEAAPPTAGFSLSPEIIAGALGFAFLLVSVIFLVRGYSIEFLRAERSFDLLIVLGTMILPMLAPFPVKFFGGDPIDYSAAGMVNTGIFLIPLAIIAVAVGLWWNPRLWLMIAALFYGIFTVLYTTFFTNGQGFFTGLVGSLGYWLEQQGVQRGDQPWFYYIFVQIPIYEFLPALAMLLALFLGLRYPVDKSSEQSPDGGPEQEAESDPVDGVTSKSSAAQGDFLPTKGPRLALALIGFWIITSLILYAYAGEKMPWLTVHIAWPMILLAGWALGRLIETTDWKSFQKQRGLLVIILMLIFLLSLAAILGTLLGPNPPFQGKELAQLQTTSTFLTSFLVAIASGFGLFRIAKTWNLLQIARLFTLTIFGVLVLLTARAAYMASFINFDYATEFLVYAHSAPGPKDVYQEVREISERITDGLALEIAYDNDTTYPYWWYLRNFTNHRYYGENPTRDLRDAPVIIVGNDNYGKIEPIVGQAYHRFDHIRMWWPIQDYFNLTWERVWNAIIDPKMRSALFQIWLNRDYTEYGVIKGQDMSTPNWQPSDEMRYYLRKDIAAQIWEYGVGPSAEEVVADPYEGKGVMIPADIILGTAGTEPGQFQRPRGLAVASDGTLFIADTDNHRIQHVDQDGNTLHVWGSFADISTGEAPGGTFYEPWSLTIGPDGSVYVADTWNHRIQKFTPEGEFVNMWGFFGQAESPYALWGPRDVTVDNDGNILVTDTGNKRIVIFDADGNSISEFGGAGFSPGEFDEPVGLAADSEGNLYINDTWNQRIQNFKLNSPSNYDFAKSWDVYGWFGQSLDNKPYINTTSDCNVYVTDPEGYRVLEFTPEGEIVRYWGDYGQGSDSFGMAGAVAVDDSCGVWVSDSGNSRIMHFTLP